MPTARLRLVAVLTLLFAVVAVGAYAWRLGVSNDHLRADALAQVELRAKQLAGAAAGQADAMIRVADFALIHLRDEYEVAHNIEGDVRAFYNGLPANTVTQIGVIDAEGYLAWSSVGVTGRIYLGDREHFKAHRHTDDDVLFISRPVLGRASGVWSIQFSRPLRQKGKFAGVLVVSLAPEFFANSYANLALNPNDTIALFRPDGAYLMRVPNLLEAMGKSVPAERPFIGAPVSAHGTFRTAAAFDNVKRTFAWRRLDNYPVAVVLGIEEAAVLDPVESEINRALWRRNVGGLLVLALATGVSLLLLRAGRQQLELVASEMRHRGFFERNTSVQLLVEPASGRIVDANPAAVDFYGNSRESLLAMTIGDIDCQPAGKAQIENALAESEHRLYRNSRHRLASGDIRDVEVYSGPVEVEGKTLILSIIHDVTVRHDLERRLAASEALHRGLFLTMAEGVVVVNRTGQIAAWNNAAITILGVDVSSLVAFDVAMLGADGEPLPADKYPTLRAVQGEQLDHVLFGVRQSSGKLVWLALSSRSLGPASDPMLGVAVLSFSDITSLVEAEESLRLAQSVFEVAGEGIMVTDVDNRIVAVNPAFSRLTGYSAAEVVGKSPSLLASGQHDAAFYAAMWQRLAHDGHWEGEISNRHKAGHIFVEWLRITVVPERPGHGRRYVALFSDITDRKREAEVVWRQANFDDLTGLPNRNLLEDRLKRAIAQAHRKHSTVALMFIDLDRFKPVNDVYGHAAGDDLLRQVAKRIEHCLRDEDTVARIGGDEFVVVLPDLRVADAPGKAAEKVVAVLTEPFRIGTQYVEISCSIGIALFPKNADNPEQLIASADAAMYTAKNAGRSTWRQA